mmetsp:Transcript_9880/g.17800  ORF Transcript_9880/g.17800 Transcript_9880/m.17800 type:complete len:335 (-) Transcript_9880:354-1358(-)|eukprot:CAMPEP_0182449184 /NCGR_PEP_ID=MMETSP1172-20130603/32386_1 /TAXON_ID=708627 /ORGANISM="Timspurckia oligopyrenoides, Strain CCMP3278" /LENGTH=334 /DNA_ID=CAMNT_0024646349 /DNA_START=27 /DNA_END=1031 /DNA_ORIENTATION=-
MIEHSIGNTKLIAICAVNREKRSRFSTSEISKLASADVSSSSGVLSASDTFKIGLISGGAAGTVADFVLFPLDTIKTRLQSSSAARAAPELFKGIYQGLLPAVLASAPAGAAFFGTYDFLKRSVGEILEKYRPDGSLAPLAHMVAAAGGDIASSAVRVPFELVKQKLQTGQYSSVLNAVRGIVAKDGIKGLYTGYFSLVLRELPFDLIEFPLYELMKKTALNIKRSRTGSPQARLENWESAACGSFAGAIAAAVTTPLDVVKTRLMTAPPGKYNGVLHAMKLVIEEEGANALLSGFTARVMWIGLGGAIFFGGYESTKRALEPKFIANKTKSTQ